MSLKMPKHNWKQHALEWCLVPIFSLLLVGIPLLRYVTDAVVPNFTKMHSLISLHEFIIFIFILLYIQVGGLTYKVPTGRRDGRVSLASDTANLPSFRDSVDVQKKKFSDVGLSAQDLVTLVGKPEIYIITKYVCSFCMHAIFEF